MRGVPSPPAFTTGEVCSTVGAVWRRGRRTRRSGTLVARAMKPLRGNGFSRAVSWAHWSVSGIGSVVCLPQSVVGLALLEAYILRSVESWTDATGGHWALGSCIMSRDLLRVWCMYALVSTHVDQWKCHGHQALCGHAGMASMMSQRIANS